MTDALEGKPLPSAKLQSSDGKLFEVPHDFRGRWTVLYTYPKDDTPGCTKEACAFRDSKAQFESAGANVFGLSLDDSASHNDFIAKYSLNFPLLTDADTKFSAALGAYGEQEWNGHKYLGLSRDTFLIDPQGVVRKVFRKVNPVATIQETFEELNRLRGSASA